MANEEPEGGGAAGKEEVEEIVETTDSQTE